MSQLGENQCHDMTPRTEGSHLLVDAGFPRQLRDQMVRNVVENLPEQRIVARCWCAGGFFIFHTCRMAEKPQLTNTFFSRLWDGCVKFSILNFQSGLRRSVSVFIRVHPWLKFSTPCVCDTSHRVCRPIHSREHTRKQKNDPAENMTFNVDPSTSAHPAHNLQRPFNNQTSENNAS